MRLNGKHYTQNLGNFRVDTCKAKRITADTLKRVVGFSSRQHIICRCAERIDIRPRTLIAFFLILLDGCEAGFNDNGKALAFLRHILACRDEVDELDVTFAANENIIGLNISVQKVGAVNDHERIRYLIEQMQEFAI